MRKSIRRAAIALLLVGLVVSVGAVFASDDVGELIPARPITKSRVEPSYPPAALAAKFEGAVVLGVTVHRDGTVGDVAVVETSRPNLGFEAAATEAMKQWAFSPALLDGEPVDSQTYVRLNFRVPGGRLDPGAYVASGVVGSTSIGSGVPGVGMPGPVSLAGRGGFPPRAGDGSTASHGPRERIVLPRKPPCGEVGCIYNRNDLWPKSEYLAQLPAPID